jgi:hypothetical protein
MPVYLRGGGRLGIVLEVGHALDYLHVQQGRLVVRDWYVPMSAVRDVTTEGVYLNADRADLVRNRWNVPAREYLARQGATQGYEYTSPADLPASAGSGAGDGTGA